ncbi:unnamed protein product [Allacma fusca]|uniref:Secreted protein n=1 Tax=Allacma fusca TaxID=39272 RepID=A0A8J2LK42_9HEXA|nr:unnamed protein product [Allacma fusca]
MLLRAHLLFVAFLAIFFISNMPGSNAASGRKAKQDGIPRIDFQKKTGHESGRGVQNRHKSGKSAINQAIPKIEFQKRQGNADINGRAAEKPFQFGKTVVRPGPPKKPTSKK